MSDQIRVTFGFSRRLFRRSVMAFFFSAVPQPSTSFRILFWLVVWLGVLGGVITAGALQISATVASIAALVIVGLYIIGLQQYRMGKFYSALAEHWDRTGDMTAEFDETGARFTQEHAQMTFAWSAVDDVVRTRGGTVFRIGMSMITVPDDVLPDGLSPKDFRTQLNAWRTA